MRCVHRLLLAALVCAWPPPATEARGASQTGVADCRAFAGPYLLEGRVLLRTGQQPPLMEVRLERDAGVWMTSAYTDSNGEFAFTDLVIDFAGVTRLTLVVSYEGFRTVRHEVHPLEIACNFGALVLFLERAPPPEADGERPDGAPTVGLQQLLAEIPDEAVEELDQAVALLEDGGGPEVITHLENAVQLAPNYYDALNKLGVEYLKAGRLPEAEEVLARASALNPSDPRPLVHLGQVKYQTGLQSVRSGDAPSAALAFREAADIFQTSVRLDPLEAEPAFLLGLALYELRNYASAELALLEALALDPSFSDARLALINVFTRQQLYDEALAEIAAFLEDSPDSPRRGAVEAIRIQIEAATSR